jgi:hypothetical protein
VFTSSWGWLLLWTLSNQPILFHSCIQVESDQVAWVLHTEKFTTETGKWKGKKIALRSILQISSFTNIQLPFVGNLSKEMKIQHAIINFHGRAWQQLKSLGLLAWWELPTHAVLPVAVYIYLISTREWTKTQICKSWVVVYRRKHQFSRERKRRL